MRELAAHPANVAQVGELSDAALLAEATQLIQDSHDYLVADAMDDGRWFERHKAFLARAKPE